MRKVRKYLIFALILLYIPLWSQTNSFLSSLGKDKESVELVRDDWVIDTLKEKTNTNIEIMKVLNSDLLFGMMVGIPGNPQLILSKKLYQDFNIDELEYVILHEAGHYKLSHSIIELCLGISFLILGIFLLNYFRSTVLHGVLLGLLFGISMIQVGRLNEVQADNFSLKKMTNPEGMITATNKFEEAWKNKSSKNEITRFIFYRGNPYKNRIKMAKNEISTRLK